ncbi:MAG: SGNH/GDSL hydrolase family protein [Verrucomicrobiae bacterium]|nr:SGNH/GDSL hydrolase family protein [Verrucomicrobiae bacterium]
MKKRRFLRLALLALAGLAALLPLATPALFAATNDPARWENEIAAFEAADRTNPPPPQPILFLGSSSIRLWKSLPQDFPRHHVLNRGFGGSQIADSLHFADRIVFPYQPRKIIMYAGGNDINAGKSPQQVAADFMAFVHRVHQRLPQTTIAYISIAPNPARWAQIERVREANRLIKEFTRSDPRLEFIDVFPHMLGPDGLPLPDIFVDDRLHMNDRGYALWKKIVAPFLGPPDRPQ